MKQFFAQFKHIHFLNRDSLKDHPGWLILVPNLIYLGLVLFTLFRVLEVNNGKLTYGMDDAYIHLSLAEKIGMGTYGLNLGEFSAPSSTILWPFLLVPFSRLPFFDLVPFFLNILFSCLSITITSFFLLKFILTEEIRYRNYLFLLTSFSLLFFSNLVGLTFIGMEDCLEVFISILIIYGLTEFLQTGNYRWYFPASLIIAPLIRYETLAFVVPILLVIRSTKQKRIAVSVAVCIALLLGAFSLFLYVENHTLLPNSILAKSEILSSTRFIDLVITNLVNNLSTSQGAKLGIMMVLFLLLMPAFRASDNTRYNLAAVNSLACLLFLLFGDINNYYRYETFILFSALIAILFLYKERFLSLANYHPPVFITVFVALMTITLGLPYLMEIKAMPDASSDIYLQQYQMHRFVTEYYQKPVAVNDIGYVTFKNPNYTLDLFGLSSTEALRMKTDGKDQFWMETLTAEKDVHLAIIYDFWFPNIPPNWEKVALLTFDHGYTTCSSNTVTFFLTDPQYYEELIPKLNDFSHSLPEHANLLILERKADLTNEIN